MCPTDVVGPLESVFNVQIRVAAAPAGKLRRSGLLAGINERHAGEPQLRSGKHGDIVIAREADTVLSAAENAAVMTHVTEAELIHQAGCEDVNI